MSNLKNFWDKLQNYIFLCDSNHESEPNYFEYRGSKISYEVAHEIYDMMVECGYLEEQLDKTEDYNRLLRKENKELRFPPIKIYKNDDECEEDNRLIIECDTIS